MHIFQGLSRPAYFYVALMHFLQGGVVEGIRPFRSMPTKYFLQSYLFFLLFISEESQDISMGILLNHTQNIFVGDINDTLPPF